MLLALVMLGPLVPPTVLADQAPPDPLFVSARRLTRLEGDPWLGAAWFGTVDAGLFAKPLDEPGLYWYGTREGLSDTTVHAIEVTSQRVYVGTEGGVDVLDKATQRFTRVNLSDGDPLDTTSRMVYAEDGGDVWIGTDEAGLFRAAKDDLVAEPVPNPVNGSRFDHPILGLTSRGPELFISAAGYGLVRWDRETGQTEHYNMSLLWPEPQYGRTILTEESVWVGTSGDGAIEYDLETGEGHEYMGPETLSARRAIGLTAVGSEVWFATDAGTARHDTESGAWHNYQADEFPWGRAADIELINGSIYATSKAGEIVRFDRGEGAWEVVSWWQTDQVLPYNVVAGCSAHTDSVVVTTGGGGSVRFLVDEGRYETIGDEPGHEGQDPPGILHRSAAEDDQVLWIGHQRGLSRYDKATNAWTDHRTDDGPLRKLPQNVIKDLQLTETGLWAAVSSDKPEPWKGADAWSPGHVAHYDRDDGSWTIYNESQGLSGQNVSAVLYHDGLAWAGLNTHGLDVIDPSTGSIEHVYPEGTYDNVNDLVAARGSIWGAAVEGLLRVNTSTLETEVIDLGDVALTTLSRAAGTLWIGTAGAGLIAYDLATGEHTRYAHEGRGDIWSHCSTVHNGIVYLGTQWGLERFDIQEQRFLSKGPTIRAFLDQATGTVDDREDRSEGTLAITSPQGGTEHVLTDPLAVAGSAQGPDGAVVQVRAGTGAWVQAEGLSSWQAEVTASDQGTGEATIVARLVVDNRTVAQAGRTITLVTGDQAPRSVSVSHDPILEAYATRSATIAATASPSPPGLAGQLHLKGPGNATWRAIDMVPSGQGTLVSEVGFADHLGPAAYRIQVTWDGGTARLPEPGSPYGEAYPLEVLRVPGHAALTMVVGAIDDVTPGGTIALPITLQNTGTRDATFDLQVSGPAASWVHAVPEPVHLDAASSHRITLNLTVPSQVQPGQDHLTLTGAPTDPSAGIGHTQRVDLPVTNETGPGQGSSAPEDPSPVPSPWSWGLLVVLLVAGLLRRRRPGASTGPC